MTFSTEEKVQAVLAAWTEKMSQTEICRQMQINYATFQAWQNRAMEGMMQALENQLQLGDTAVLSPRLRKLMEKGRSTTQNRFDQRLKNLQQESDKSPKN
jgi:transposase-like protein